MNVKTKNFELNLDGFFQEYKEASLPNQSGIYFVFGGCATTEGKCRIQHLIYIGESRDIADRLSKHEKKPEFKDTLGDNEILYYAYTLVPTRERELCEKGLIRHFADRFGTDKEGSGLINELSTKSFTTDFDILNYVLSGAVPRIFTESDRRFSVSSKH